MYVEKLTLTNWTSLCVVILMIYPATTQAGKLEQWIRNVQPVFAEGNYFEISGAYSDFTQEGADLLGNSTGDFLGDEFFIGAAVKGSITDNLSFAAILQQPYSGNLEYQPGSLLTGFQGKLSTHALSGILKYNPTDKVSVYGGPVYQKAEADFAIPGSSTGQPINYRSQADSKGAWGYVVGAAYELPDYKARASLTYHSKISHDWQVSETGIIGPNEGEAKFITPQSVDLEFQAPINPKTLLMGTIHWADWSADSFSLPYPVLPKPLTKYNGDVWGFGLGAVRKIREDWFVGVGGAYEPKGDEDSSPTSTNDGQWALAVSSINKLTPSMTLTTQLAYTTLIATEGNPAVTFDDGDIWSFNTQLGFHF